MLVKQANMDGRGGLGMSHFEAMRLTIPQALYYLGEGGKKRKVISAEKSQQVQEEMSERDKERIKKEINAKIAFFNGQGQG